MAGLARSSAAPLYNNRPTTGNQKSSSLTDFVPLSLGQWLLVWWYYTHGKLDFFSVRVYFALIFMQSAWRPPPRPRRCIGRYPPMRELSLLLRSRDSKRMRRALRQLRVCGLVAPDSWAPMAPVQVLAAAQAWLAAFPRRKTFLVPRAYLRALARHTAKTPALMAVLLAAQVRHLWRRDPASPARQCFLSASWVSARFGVSRRQVSRVFDHATKEQSAVRIERLPSSPAHAYRHGALRRITMQPERRPRPRARQASGKEGQGTQMSELLPGSGTQMSPPYESRDPFPLGTCLHPRSHQDIGVERENQDEDLAGTVADDGQVVHAQEPTTPATESVRPTLRDVRPEHLRRDMAVQQLYQEACACGWLRRCEAHELFAFAAAEHALHVPDIANRGGLFYELLRAGPRGELAAYITDADEDRARSRLRALREPSPARPLHPVVQQAQPARAPTPELSEDAQLVALIIAGLRQVGWRGDAFLAFKSHDLGRAWTRERWNVAYADWQHWQHWHGGRDGP